MAKIEKLTNVNGETVYPRTLASAVSFDDNRTVSALATNSVYMKEADGVEVAIAAAAATTNVNAGSIGVNADTLGGHDSSYFAKASELEELRQLVLAQAQEIDQLKAQLNGN